MADHAAREHAQWSASSTDRNWHCAGALALTDGLPETTNEAADWGTCAHQLAEKVLHGHGPADRYIGTTEKGKKFSFEVDEEMTETAQMYCDYVVSRIDSFPDVILHVEQHFTLNGLKPPFDAGGTADAVLYYPEDRMLEVVDLKGGRGVVVEVKGNPQLRTYALGAVLANPGLPVDRVKVTIVQPRAGHKDGRIRSETFHIADLVEWTAELLVKMRLAAEATHDERGLSKAEWNSTYLKAGAHCKFCKATSFCPALERKALDAASVWFDDLDAPHLANDPDPNDPAKLSRDLDMLDMIEDWIAARRARAHDLAETGVTIPNYILVEKQGREKWNDGVEQDVLKAAKGAGLAAADYLNPSKLRTPKQVREKLGAKAGLVAGLSNTPIAGTNLVRETKSTRPAVAAGVNKHFSPIED